MKKIFFIILCLFFNVNGHTQSVIKHCPAIDASYTLVNYWEKNISIVYVHTLGDEGYFLYERSGAPSIVAKIAQNARITDFKILDDTVFYCGYRDMAGSTMGIVGFFDIYDVFFNGGLSDFCLIQGTDYLNSCKMKIPRRMDVYRHKGIVHIAMVGDMSDIDLGGDPDGATIEEAFFDGTQWHLYNMQNKNNTEYYTDITCTGNYVVAAARSRTGNACYIKAFQTSSAFLTTPINAGYITEIVDGSPFGDIMVQAIDTNAIAIGYYYNGTTDAGFTLKLIKVNPMSPTIIPVSSILQTQCTSTVSPSPWMLHEMRYNSSLQRIYVLQDMDYPLHSLTTSTVLDYTINYSSLLVTSCKASWIGRDKLTDLDAYKTDGFHSTGEYFLGGTVFFKKHTNADTLCSPEQNVKFKSSTPSLINALINEHAPTASFPNNTFLPEIMDFENILDCVEP